MTARSWEEMRTQIAADELINSQYADRQGLRPILGLTSGCGSTV